MIKPDIPTNEKERLKALHEYGILDTLQEHDYDDLTGLASDICQTPIALVSLIDKNRQWFKSHHGIEKTETPREIAFCAHAINYSGDFFEVRNSREDERFHDNPLVTGAPNIVFYLGIPLINQDGFRLGSFCVIDHEPRELTEYQKKALKILSNQVIKLFELRKRNLLLGESHRELSNAHTQILDSISSAKIIQTALMPKLSLEKTGSMSVFSLFLPKNIVSGDFYWLHESEERAFMVLADCTGHGVSGALLTVLGISFLNEIIKGAHGNDPAEILEQIDRRIKENTDYGTEKANRNRDGMDMGIAAYHKIKKEITFSGASINLYCFFQGTKEVVSGTKRKIGYSAGSDRAFGNTVFKVSKNQVFYLFSDGYQDQFNGMTKEKFYLERLLSLLSEISDFPLPEQKERLLEKLNEWKGNRPQTDDILVVGWKYN